jgi:hypothetical protein
MASKKNLKQTSVNFRRAGKVYGSRKEHGASASQRVNIGCQSLDNQTLGGLQ